MTIKQNSVEFLNHNITFFIDSDGKIDISDFPEDFIDLVKNLTDNRTNYILK